MEKTPLKMLLSIMSNGVANGNPFEWKRVAESLLEYEKKTIIKSYHVGRVECALEILNNNEIKSFDDIYEITPFKEGEEYYTKTFIS